MTSITDSAGDHQHDHDEHAPATQQQLRAISELPTSAGIAPLIDISIERQETSPVELPDEQSLVSLPTVQVQIDDHGGGSDLLTAMIALLLGDGNHQRCRRAVEAVPLVGTNASYRPCVPPPINVAGHSRATIYFFAILPSAFKQ